MKILSPTSDNLDAVPKNQLVVGTSIREIRKLTQTEYNAIVTKSETTLYIISG